MSFEPVALQRGSSRASNLASITINSPGRLTVSFVDSEADAAGIKSGERFGLLVGRGDDEGKIRIAPQPDGIAAGRVGKTMRVIRFGAVPAFGVDEHPKTLCGFRVIEPGVVEIDLPAWGDAKAARERRPSAAVVPSAPIKPPAPVPAKEALEPTASPAAAPRPAAPPAEKAPGEALIRHGISIDLTFGVETISHKGETADISTRQAAVLVALLRAFPEAVSRDWVCDRVLGDVKSSARQVTLDMVLKDLPKNLKAIGLVLSDVRGVGLRLQKLGA